MTDPKRYCVFCDKEVTTAVLGKALIGPDAEGQRFIHIAGQQNTCFRNTLDESQTYTEGVSDSQPEE